MIQRLLTEPDDVRREATLSSTTCPFCAATEGQCCINVFTGQYTTTIHSHRIEAFKLVEHAPMVLT